MFGAIGDALLASSIIHDIRSVFPLAKIVAYVSAVNKEVFRLIEGPDASIVTPVSHPLHALRELRQREFDLLIDVGQWLRISALLAALSGARFTIGFKTPGQGRHWAFDAMAEHFKHRHDLHNFRALLRCIDIESLALPIFRQELFDRAASCTRPPYVVFHPWASGFRCHLREWPTDHWTMLARIVLDHGHEVVVTGGPTDLERSKTFASGINHRNRVCVLAGSASLSDTAVVFMSLRDSVWVKDGVR